MKIAIDIRDFRLASSGTKTYLQGLLTALKKQSSPALVILELDSIFLAASNTTPSLFHKIKLHLFTLIWKQLILPIKCWRLGADVLICTDYMLPLTPLHTKKLVVFHPFASDPMRRWGIERFIDLAKSLNETYKYQILFIGSKNELDEAKAAISSQVPRAVLYDDTVRKTMGIINESNLLIGGDSGFTHVSVAVNVPTIVLQGPLAKDRPRDKDLYTNTKNNFVFYKELLCRDILYTACGACSERICFEFSVDTILDKALKILN